MIWLLETPPYHSPDHLPRKGAPAIYHKFVELGQQLSRRAVVMIIPARWYMFRGHGLKAFSEKMLSDTRLRELHDFPISAKVFPAVDIDGGLCYFLWEREYQGPCKVVSYLTDPPSVSERFLREPGLPGFIRFHQALPIVRKVLQRNEPSFRSLVGVSNHFGLYSTFSGSPEPFDGAVIVRQRSGVTYADRSVVKRNYDLIDRYKVFISRAGEDTQRFPNAVVHRIVVAGPNTVCTGTYDCIGPFDTQEQARNVAWYITTKFFRFLLSMVKLTHCMPRSVYALVLALDPNTVWTDDDLYRRYHLSADEIAFIDSLIRPLSRDRVNWL